MSLRPVNLVRDDGMCFLNIIESCLLHNHNEVLSIKSITRLITSDIEIGNFTASFRYAVLKN